MRWSLTVHTRKRPDMLRILIESIFRTVRFREEVEIHITYDDDDEETACITDEIIKGYPNFRILSYPSFPLIGL